MKVCKILAVLVLVPAIAQAAIVGTALGSGARSDAWSPYAMTAFNPDPSPTFPDVTSVLSPLRTRGVDEFVTFSRGGSHRRIGSGWATWSGGYTGDVYYFTPTTVPVTTTMTLPASTTAFSFYAEPNPFSPNFDITATANDGTSVTQSVSGSSGASGYGFYTAGGALTSIAVSCATDFAIGEFRISKIPEPATLSLLSLGALALIRRR
jgi:hypothetical protein